MKLYVIGIGPGGVEDMTHRAVQALQSCTVVAGYPVYLELIADLIAGKRTLSSPMKQEVQRCTAARDAARAGETVAMVSSGDAGVYGMAGIMHEVCADDPQITIEVIPGVTAACAAAAVLGAPLIHDFAVISLSDLLTPWAKIEARLRAAAQADFVICLYNPSSKKRADYVRRACDIVREAQGDGLWCGTVRQAGRAGQESHVCTLAQLYEQPTDMFTTVIIGNSQTRNIGGKLVTPRGYGI